MLKSGPRGLALASIGIGTHIVSPVWKNKFV